MITSKFSRMIAPLAVTTVIAGGMTANALVKSEEKHTPKTEQKVPITEDPALLGTLFTLGLLGTAGAATMAKAVDVRYKDAKDEIDMIYDITTLKESDYKEAFEDECKILDEKGELYNKEELRKQYAPKSRDEVVGLISSYQNKLRRVTQACNQDKEAARQVQYLTAEVKSAASYGYDIENDDIKHRMHYQFDKATLPKKKWKEAETQYKADYPHVDFDKQNGVKTKSFARYAAEKAVIRNLNGDWYSSLDTEQLLEKLTEIQTYINAEPEVLNQYDRKMCNSLIDEAYTKLSTEGDVSTDILKAIGKIYIENQQTY